MTEKSHWDSIYGSVIEGKGSWKPQYYLDKLIDGMITEVIEKEHPKSVLEIGCGNSVWLPYIHEKYGVDIYGIDYSQRGVELVKNKLEEHFTNPFQVISIYKELLNPGGVLLTEVPYITGTIGKVCRFYQPQLYNMHVAHTEETLRNIYHRAGISCKKCQMIGHFTLDMVAWGVAPRFPHIDRLVQIGLKMFYRKNNKRVRDTPEDAAFIYIYGEKLVEGDK